MKFKIELVVLVCIIINCYFIINNRKIEKAGVNKDNCIICNSAVYEHTNLVKLREDCIGILYINSGFIDEIRLYELDEQNNEVDQGGVMLKTGGISSPKGSYGSNVTFPDNQKAYISIILGKKHKPILSKISKLYCKEHIEEIKHISNGLDIALLDFKDKKLHSLKGKELDFNIRNYNIKVSQNKRNIELDINYNKP